MKLKLFPHSVQKPAAILFACSLILLLFFFFGFVEHLLSSVSEGLSSNNSSSSWFNTTGLFYFRIIYLTCQISLALLLFSKEKVEDEMINHLRLRAASISAAIVIGLIIIESVIWMLLPADIISSFGEIRRDLKGTGIGSMIVLYLILFRTSIRKYTKGSNEE